MFFSNQVEDEEQGAKSPEQGAKSMEYGVGRI